MKRPIIALSLTFLFSLIMFVVVRGREPDPTPPATTLNVPVITQPQATATPSPTATREMIVATDVPATLSPTATPGGRAPLIAQRSPFTNIFTERDQPVTLTFTQAMDHETVAAALAIIPAVDYHLNWGGDKKVSLVPDTPFLPGVTYTLTVTTTATNQAGVALPEPYITTFRTRDIVSNVYISQTNLTVPPIKIVFGYEVDQASVAAAITFDPPLDGVLSWLDTRTARYTLREALLPGASYTLSFTSDLKDKAGQPLPVITSYPFTVPSALLSHAPDDQATRVKTSSSLSLTFDRAIDLDSLSTAFSISPEISGLWSLQGNTATFTPDDTFFAANTHYTVTIQPTATSASGELLMQEPYQFSFTTADRELLANFGWGPHIQVVDTDGRRAIQFQTNRPGTPMTFELYHLSNDQFLTFYPDFMEGSWYDAFPLADLSGLSLTTSWEMTLDTAHVRQFEGIAELIIPDDVPAGLYLLNLKMGVDQDQLLLALSQHALAAKMGLRQMTAWVSDTNDQPVAEVDVLILDAEGNVLHSGRTNNLGIYKTALNPAAPAPFLVLAQQGDDVVVTGFDWDWRSYSYSGSSGSGMREGTLPYASAIYTDRPIYRPGDIVSYKAIIRRDEDAVLDMIPAGTTVTIRIADARNNTVKTDTLFTNNFGTVTGSFTLAEGAMSGDYNIYITLGTYSKSQLFKVEDYRKPEYEVSISTDAAAYTNGEQVAIAVNANYYFGEPVAAADVTLTFYELESYYYYYDWEESPAGMSWQESWLDPLTSHTAADGTATFTWTADFDYYDSDSYWGSNLRWHTYGLEVTVNDGNAQPVSSFSIIRVYNRQEQIKFVPGRYVYAPGETFTLQADVSTIGGDPVSGRNLTLYISRYDYSEYDYVTISHTSGTATNSSGRGSFNLAIEDPGFYRLTVQGQDSNGLVTMTRRWVYIYRPGISTWATNANALRVYANATDYVPGDTAQLMIESNFSGPALLTFERATTRREMMVELTAPLTLVDVPIQADDVPNIFVTVNAWRPQDTQLLEEMYTTIPDSRFVQASVNLSVPATHKTLNVTITPDRAAAAPRQELSLTIRVTNQAGVPVSAELSLAMVDEAIFALSEDLSGPLYDAFYFQRFRSVITYDAYELERYLLSGGMGGGGGDGGFGPGNPRMDFRDTAYWFPTLTTDANGEVVVTVTLPDNLTSWRFTAKAITADTQVGEAIVNVVTQQDVMVRPQLPRTLTTGDNLNLSALVQNFSDQPQTLTVGVMVPQPLPEAGTPISFTGTLTQVITLAPNETRIVGWPAEAVNIGTAELIFYATNEEGPSDAIALMIPVRPLAIPNVTTDIGQFTTATTSQLLWPENALPNSTVRIELSRSIAGTMLDGLAYLTGFPYGCVEQTMSRALPNAVVARAFNQLGVGTPALQADLTAKIDASIQRLYGFQHEDGGWGWWHDDDSHDYQTAWVIFGLAVMADGGYAIDPFVIERGATWLDEALPQMAPATRAYALYSLAVAEYGNLEATQTLAQQAEALDTFSQAGLALALWELGETTEARALLDHLADTATVNGGMVHWSGSNNDGSYDHKIMASDTRTTALVLSAFAQIQPGHSLEAGTVRWLMAQRRATGWGTTNETSYAILGLTDHLLAVQAAGGNTETNYRVELNGAAVAQGNLQPGALAVTVEIAAASFQPGPNSLRLSHSGTGLMYYSVVQRVYVNEPSIAAAGTVTVARRYLNAATNQPLTTNPHVGDLIRVELRYTLVDEAYYLLVEDQLPGGLEALNERLNTTSHEGSLYYGEQRSYWRDYGYNFKEVRGDRVSFFVTEADAGMHVITYLARVTHSGSFSALPTEVSAMYDVSTWGRSASHTLSFIAAASEE